MISGNIDGWRDVIRNHYGRKITRNVLSACGFMRSAVTASTTTSRGLLSGLHDGGEIRSSRVSSLSSRGAQRRGDLVPAAAFPAPTRLPRCARNVGSGEPGARENSEGLPPSRVPSLSSRGAQRRGDLVPVAASVAPTRLPRCARNDGSGEPGARENSEGLPPSRVSSLSSRGAQRRGGLVPAAASVAPTRLPRCARNDRSSETGYA